MFAIEPWHWLVFGLLLIMLELMIPTFALLLFGIGALVTALVTWVLPIGGEAQVLIWLALSVVFSVLWFKFLKPLQKDKTKAGLGGQAIIGEVGIITTAPVGEQKGVIRFSVPKLGTDEWSCRSNADIKVGDRVSVVKILGNELLVEKTAHQ